MTGLAAASERSGRARATCWALIAVFALAYVALLGLRPLTAPDESRYAEIAREMVASGDWVVPRVLGLRYFEKPVGGYWAFALGLAVFGENAFGLRFFCALATGLTALVLGLVVGRAARDRELGVLAAAVYLSMPMVFGLGTYGVLDPLLAWWVVAALAAAWMAFDSRRPRGRFVWWGVLGACCGMGFLTKGFVALALVVVAVAPFMLWERRWRELFTYGWWAVAVAILVVSPWAVAVHLREPDYWRYFVMEEHVRRFLAEDAQHRQPFWFYLPVLVGLGLPWTVALGGTRDAVRAAIRGDSAARFGMASLVLPLLFLSASKGKLATYVLPCFAPLAAAIAAVLARSDGRGRFWSRAIAWLASWVGVLWALGAGGLWIARPAGLWGEGDASRFAVACAIGLGWAAWSWRVVRGRVAVVPALAWLPLALGLAGAFAVPAKLRDAKMPGEFLAEVASRVPSNAAVACDSISAIFSVAFELRRRDVVVVGGAGELEYGARRTEAADRWLQSPKDFAAWLERTRRLRPVVLFSRVARDESLSRYPTPDRVVRGARMSLLHYGRRPR